MLALGGDDLLADNQRPDRRGRRAPVRRLLRVDLNFTTVDEQRASGHETGLRCRQKQHGSGDFLGAAEPTPAPSSSRGGP